MADSHVAGGGCGRTGDWAGPAAPKGAEGGSWILFPDSSIGRASPELSGLTAGRPNGLRLMKMEKVDSQGFA